MSLSRPGPVLSADLPTRSAHAVGRVGEDLAATYLTDLGWQVLDRNWRPGSGLRGELDLVALEPASAAAAGLRGQGETPTAANLPMRAPVDGGQAEDDAPTRPTLVVVEVKTRSTLAAGPPAAAVTRLKVARLRALTAAWLACHDCPGRAVRLDVVSIRLRPGLPALLRHHRGVSL